MCFNFFKKYLIIYIFLFILIISVSGCSADNFNKNSNSNYNILGLEVVSSETNEDVKNILNCIDSINYEYGEINVAYYIANSLHRLGSFYSCNLNDEETNYDIYCGYINKKNYLQNSLRDSTYYQNVVWVKYNSSNKIYHKISNYYLTSFFVTYNGQAKDLIRDSYKYNFKYYREISNEMNEDGSIYIEDFEYKLNYNKLVVYKNFYYDFNIEYNIPIEDYFKIPNFYLNDFEYYKIRYLLKSENNDEIIIFNSLSDLENCTVYFDYLTKYTNGKYCLKLSIFIDEIKKKFEGAMEG